MRSPPAAPPAAHEGGLAPWANPGVAFPFVREEWAASAPSGFELAAELFDDARIPEVEVELSDEAVQALRVDPYTWVDGAFVYRGVRFEPVGVRLKGQRGFLPIDEKPSLKIKLNHSVPGTELLGLEVLTLNAMATDASMMRERLAYRLFREHGLPASRANHARVLINGELRGLYTLVETVDEELLALRYADPSGTMWELYDVDFVDGDVDAFELESGPEDRGPLQAIADALELGGPASWSAVEPWVDQREFVAFTAATAVSGQFDSYPWRTPGDDVHLYFDPADGRMDILPHGLDETFKRRNFDIFSGTGLLFQACLADPACAAEYEALVLEVQDTSERIDLLGYARDVQRQIAALVEEDPARPYTTDEVATAQQLVLDFVTTRRDHLIEQVGARR